MCVQGRVWAITACLLRAGRYGPPAVAAVATVGSRCCRWKPLVSLIAVDGRGQVVGGSHIPQGGWGIFETTPPVECGVLKDWYSLQRPGLCPRPLEGIRTNNNIPTPTGGLAITATNGCNGSHGTRGLPTAATVITIPGGNQRLPTAFATPG